MNAHARSVCVTWADFPQRVRCSCGGFGRSLTFERRWATRPESSGYDWCETQTRSEAMAWTSFARCRRLAAERRENICSNRKSGGGVCVLWGWFACEPLIPGLQEMPPFRSRPTAINRPSLAAWGGMFLDISMCSRVGITVFCEVALSMKATSRVFVCEDLSICPEGPKRALQTGETGQARTLKSRFDDNDETLRR